MVRAGLTLLESVCPLASSSTSHSCPTSVFFVAQVMNRCIRGTYNCTTLVFPNSSKHAGKNGTSSSLRSQSVNSLRMETSRKNAQEQHVSSKWLFMLAMSLLQSVTLLLNHTAASGYFLYIGAPSFNCHDYVLCRRHFPLAHPAKFTASST